MNTLELRYRRLFAAYPAEFRAEREDEMIWTLLDRARPGQQLPDLKEATAILWAGAGVRLRTAEETRQGLQLAGLVAVGLVCMLGVAAITVAALPPLTRSATPPLLGWLAVSLALCVGCRRRWGPYRLIPSILVAVLLLLGGSDLMGMRRSFLLPVGFLLLLSPLAATASYRVRWMAGLLGAGAGVALFLRFLGRSSAGLPPDGLPWEIIPRWDLAQQIAQLPAWMFVVLLLAALVCGLIKPRVAVAAALLAIPIALLTTTRLQRIEPYTVSVCAAAIVIVAAAGRARRLSRQSVHRHTE